MRFPRPSLRRRATTSWPISSECVARWARDDLLWVHFSCHGVLEDGSPLLIVKNTHPGNLTETAIPLSFVEDQLRRSRARMKVLTLDACHVGAQIGRGVANKDFNRRVYESAAGFALLAGSTSQQAAQEWADKQHGVFTFYLIEALRTVASRADHDYVTFDDIRKHVQNAVMAWSEKHDKALQQPTARIEGLGDIPLIECQHWSSTSDPSVPALDEFLFEHYEITRWILPPSVLGRSCEALDKDNRRYLIEILDPELSQDFKGRFFEEALKANEILEGNPGAVRVGPRGQTLKGDSYIVIERVPGRTLASLLSQDPPSEIQVIRIGYQIAQTLTEAHIRGIIHGDLQLENIVLVPDNHAIGRLQPKLREFGLAKLRAELSAARAEGAWYSEYRAPELGISPPFFTPASDVYALGALLHRMLVRGQPSLPRQPLPKSFPPDLVHLISRMLSEHPLDRPSLAEVLDTLGRLANLPRPSAPSVSNVPETPSANPTEAPKQKSLLARASAALGGLVMLGTLVRQLLPGCGPVSASHDLARPGVISDKPLVWASSIDLSPKLPDLAKRIEVFAALPDLAPPADLLEKPFDLLADAQPAIPPYGLHTWPLSVLPGTVMLVGEDAGVVARIDNQSVALPTEQRLPPGRHYVSYFDEKGSSITEEVLIASGVSVLVTVPVGLMGQLLGAAIDLWNKKATDGAYSKLQEAEKLLQRRKTKPEIVAHIYYYLGQVLAAKQEWLAANRNYMQFLSSPGILNQSEVEQARWALVMVRIHLASADAKVLVAGHCQVKVVWKEPGNYPQIRIEGRTLPGGFLKPGQTLHLQGDKECP